MLRARLIAGYPPDFVGSLTGLTEGRFPVAARAKYADDAAAAASQARVKAGQNAARSSTPPPPGAASTSSRARAPPSSPTNDGVVKKIGVSQVRRQATSCSRTCTATSTRTRTSARCSRCTRCRSEDLKPSKRAARVDLGQRQRTRRKDPKPTLPASAGTQSLSSAPPTPAAAPKKQRTAAKPADAPRAPAAPVTYKARLFAHPQRPVARRSGGLDQVFERQTGEAATTTYDNYFARHGRAEQQEREAPAAEERARRSIAGTVLGRVGKTDPKHAPHVYFEIRPAGKGAPKIDPKPILDGWKLLESTAVYRASGKNALYGDSSSFSVGQVLLLPKPLLEKRVLADPRVDIYPGGRHDIQTGQIDRRVLATLEYLAESGPQADRLVAEVQPRLPARAPATSQSTPPATPSTSPR